MPRAPSPAYSTGQPTRSYSDVLMARMPSIPRGLEENSTPCVEISKKEFNTPGNTVEQTLIEDPPAVSKDFNNEKKITFESVDDVNNSSSEESTSDDCKWITAMGKRAKRLACKAIVEEYPTSDLSQEQRNLVKLAENQLTEAEKERIRARESIFSRPASRDSSDTQGEGPSENKGKEPDPRNWGNVDLNNEEVDLDVQ